MTKQGLMVERSGGVVSSQVVAERPQHPSRNGMASIAKPTISTIAAVLLTCGATAARGQAIISSDSKWTGANAYQFDQDENSVGNPQHMYLEDTGGLDFLGNVSTNYNDMGFVATASSNWNHLYSPSNPGLGSAFSAAYMSGLAAAGSTSAGQWVDLNDTMGSSVVFFSVSSDTAWTLTANILGATSGTGQAFYGYSFFDDVGNAYASAFVSASGGDSIADSVNIGGVIPAGNYWFQLFIAAGTTHVFEPGSSSASIELINGVFTVPEPSAVALVGIGGLALLRRRRS